MASKNPFTISEEAIPHGDLTGKYREGWVEESFDIEHDPRRRLSIAHTSRYLGTSVAKKSISITLGIMIVGLGIIALRTGYLQLVEGGHFRGLAENNRVRLQPIAPERGIIYDQAGRELVRNVPSFSLAIVPHDLPRRADERAFVLSRVASSTGIEEKTIEDLIAVYKTYSFESLTVKENVDYDTALKLYLDNSQLPGVLIESGSRRHYLFTSTTPSLSHLLGYLGKINPTELENLRPQGYLPADWIGKVGIEKNYESSLRGYQGRKKVEVNAIGKEQGVLAVEPPVPGDNLVLSIDAVAQKALEDAVRSITEHSDKKRVAAIALHPDTGEILAFVSWPTFDNNQFSSGIASSTYAGYRDDPNRPLFNRAISGIYPAGSTVKLVIAAAALQEKIITKTTSFLSTGGITVGGTVFKDWRAGGHGATNVIRAIAWSVNTFFYYVGGGYERFTGLGVDRIARYLKAFGLNEKTGIDIPGEQSGFVPSREWKQETKKENWFVGDTYNLAIGQGDLLVTPLQAAVWTAAVANGGKIIQPHLTKKIINSATKEEVVLSYPAKSNGLVDEQTLRIVREGMRECVVSGSCQMLRGLPFEAAGKTGTAQWNRNRPTHAWFTSFAPYRNPKIVVTVLVEEGGEGAAVAEPIAYRFLLAWGKMFNQ